MFITAHTATDSSSFKASYLKGMWELPIGKGRRIWRRFTIGFEDSRIWGCQQLAKAPSFARAWDGNESGEEDQMKRKESCFGITSSSQLSQHSSAVSVSQTLFQAVSVSKLLFQTVSQLSHVPTVSALPPPVPGSTRVTRVCVLIHCNTPETDCEKEED